MPRRQYCSDTTKTDLVSMRQWIGQMQEMSKLLPYIPCLCYTEDRLPTIKIVKEYTPLKMCTPLLTAIPLKLNTTYPTGVQDIFATDNVLVLWLDVVNLNTKQTRYMLRRYVNSNLVKRVNSCGGHMSSNR